MKDEKSNPWQVKAATTIYSNPWIELTEYKVINPSGGDGIYGKVHFKNLAIGIIPMDEALNIWLVGQYRFVLNEYSWEIPEGGGAMNTEPLESAKRELLEETGLIAREWKPILEMHLSNSVSDEHAIVFLARNLEQHTAAPEDTEQLLIKKIPFEEAYKMVDEGKITDAITVAAIFKLKLMLINGQISS
ncbi:MAG: NUDIX domain-containing protein [Chitinophagaceae bacterium]